jgi:hypothetical protein
VSQVQILSPRPLIFQCFSRFAGSRAAHWVTAFRALGNNFHARFPECRSTVEPTPAPTAFVFDNLASVLRAENDRRPRRQWPTSIPSISPDLMRPPSPFVVKIVRAFQYELSRASEMHVAPIRGSRLAAPGLAVPGISLPAVDLPMEAVVELGERTDDGIRHRRLDMGMGRGICGRQGHPVVGSRCRSMADGSQEGVLMLAICPSTSG